MPPSPCYPPALSYPGETPLAPTKRVRQARPQGYNPLSLENAENKLSEFTKQIISSSSNKEHVQLLNNFINEAEGILNPNTMEIVRDVLAIAIITIIAGLVGFGFGLLIRAGAIALACGLGASATALTSYGLFKRPTTALLDFKTEVSEIIAPSIAA